MLVDGHWTLRFASVAGADVQRESGGVAVFRRGQILGGDTWSYYSGTYEQVDQNVNFRVDVQIHYTEGGESILGGPLVPYTFVGKAKLAEDGKRMNATAHVEGLGSAVVIAILTKVAETN
jgi:hypothetical protein